MVRAVSRFPGGVGEAQQLVAATPHRRGERVRAELQGVGLCVGAKAALLCGECAPLVRKLCGSRLVWHGHGAAGARAAAPGGTAARM